MGKKSSGRKRIKNHQVGFVMFSAPFIAIPGVGFDSTGKNRRECKQNPPFGARYVRNAMTCGSSGFVYNPDRLVCA